MLIVSKSGQDLARLDSGSAMPLRSAAAVYAWTIGTAAAWFAAGLAVFWAGERLARLHGNLSRF